ncbi:MAG: hypothetical protein HY719_03265 [Planctomycetes bacterium]|nr:hypothetical protein [Planctomycetota bacterium]
MALLADGTLLVFIIWLARRRAFRAPLETPRPEGVTISTPATPGSFKKGAAHARSRLEKCCGSAEDREIIAAGWGPGGRWRLLTLGD